MLNKKYINFKTCICSVDVWMGIICVDMNGLSFAQKTGTHTVGDNRVSELFAVLPSSL